MKVLLVLDQFDGANNGNTITARRLYTILKKHGHDVRILASGESRDDKWGLPTVKVPIFNELIKKQGFVFAKPVEKTIEEKMLDALLSIKYLLSSKGEKGNNEANNNSQIVININKGDNISDIISQVVEDLTVILGNI